jgi:hypothetical protein
MRVIVGGLIAGGFLWILAGAGLIGGAIGGVFAASLMLQLGPRSIVEKVGAGMTAALIAWAAGPGSGAGPGFLRYLFGWLLASAALAAYLHPRSE